jgi:hypothetical protein
MLEIILIIVFCKRIGEIVGRKGHRKFPFQLMLVALWFGGEILGGILGAVIALALPDGRGRTEPSLLFIYPFAIGGAIVGVLIAFAVANRIAPVGGDDEFYRGERDRGNWADADLGKFESRPRPGGEAITDRTESPPPPQDDRIRE